jgi:ABC-type multidrug transport system ATPase subunit
MVEQPALYNNMTATENLMTRCILMGVENPMDGYIRDKLEFVGLDDAYHDKRKVKDYSLGHAPTGRHRDEHGRRAGVHGAR